MTERPLARRLVRAFYEDQEMISVLSKALGRQSGGPTGAPDPPPGDPAFAERFRAVEDMVVAGTGVAAFSTQPTVMEMGSDPSQPVVAAIVKAAGDNVALLEEAMALGTWPGRNRVGRAGATAAEFLLGHSDAFPELRAEALPLLKEAVLAGQADPRRYAHVVDRDRALRGLPQRYGTVRFLRDGEIHFELPAGPPEEIDGCRREIGLASLEGDEAAFRQGAKPGPALGPYRAIDYAREFWPFLLSGLIRVLTGRRARRRIL